MTLRDAIPSNWTATIGDGPIAIGYDVGTTERGTSNPSSITVTEDGKPKAHVRLLVAWKSADPEIAIALLSLLLDDLAAAGHRVRRLVIDASSERFHARTVRRRLAGKCPVLLIAGNQKLRYQGEEMDSKTLLGNIWCNALDDGACTLPGGDWIAEDHRLVKREAGGFTTATGKAGEHGDTFDSSKLAWWGLRSTGGSARGIGAAQVGTGTGSAAKTSSPPASARTSKIMAAIRRQSAGRTRMLA
jgi:hypothetical protein